MFLFPYALYRVKGRSMEPTLQEGRVVFVRKRVPKQISIGDILVFFGPDKEVYIKRVGTTAGDRYVMLGDNPRDSIDSRDFGPIVARNIIGKVIWH